MRKNQSMAKLKLLDFRIFLAAFLILFYLLPTLNAQAEITLTLDEAVNLGIKTSEQVKGTTARYNATTSKRLQYYYAQLPNISATAGYTRISDNVTPFSVKFPGATDAVILNPQILNQYNMRLGAQQTVFSGFRAINFYKSSEYQEKAALIDIDRDKLDVKNLVETTFLNILKLQRTQKLLTENIALFTNRRKDATNFFVNGTGLENDVLKADLAVLQVNTTLSEVNNSILSAKYNLEILTGLTDATNLTLDETNAIATERPNNDLSYFQKLVEGRPDVTAADYRKKASETLLEVAKGNYYPTVGLFAGIVNNNPNQRVFPQEDAFKATWDAGLTLNYNITNLFTNKHVVNEAKANIDAASAQRNGLVNLAKSEVATAYYSYLSANEKLALNAQAVKQTTENARVIKSRYNSQVSTFQESLDADFQLLQAQINQQNAIIDSEIAYRKLLKAVARNKE